MSGYDGMQRISVVGNSGSGKTTAARQLAALLDVPHVELDAIFHQPGWQELPTEEFRDRIARRTQEPAWVIDGNYNAVRDLVWSRADTVVWLDLPRRRVMWRVVRRTLARLVLRRELWNGNREPLSNAWSLNPQRSIIAWAWTQHESYRQRYGDAMSEDANAHMRFIRITDEADLTALFDEAASASRPGQYAGPGG
jgi:adenylate kinase family enzyme